MEFKRLMKKIFISTKQFFKDGIKFYLENYEKSNELDLYYIKRFW